MIGDGQRLAMIDSRSWWRWSVTAIVVWGGCKYLAAAGAAAAAAAAAAGYPAVSRPATSPPACQSQDAVKQLLRQGVGKFNYY